MSTSVTYNGQPYSIPAAGELNWSSLSDFLIDVGRHAPAATGTDATTYIAGNGVVTTLNQAAVAGLKTTSSPTFAAVTAATFTGNLTGNVTGNTSGTALNVTGTVAVANGGTGLASWTAGDLPYASASTTIARLGIGTNGYFLKSNGSNPTWAHLTQSDITNLTTADSPTFAGLTITGQSGIAHFSAGVMTTSPIVTADISAGAVTYAKLSITGAIQNTDIVAGAGIPTSKLAAPGLVSQVVMGDWSVTSAPTLTGLTVNGTTTIGTASGTQTHTFNGTSIKITPTSVNGNILNGNSGQALFVGNSTPASPATTESYILFYGSGYGGANSGRMDVNFGSAAQLNVIAGGTTVGTATNAGVWTLGPTTPPAGIHNIYGPIQTRGTSTSTWTGNASSVAASSDTTYVPYFFSSGYPTGTSSARAAFISNIAIGQFIGLGVDASNNLVFGTFAGGTGICNGNYATLSQSGTFTFANGIKLPNGGGSTVTALSEYGTDTLAITLNPNGAASTNSASITLRMTRIGNVVTLTIPKPGTQAVSAGTTTILVSSANIAAAYRPSAAIGFTMAVFNGGAWSGAGWLQVTSAGTLNFFLNAGGATWTNGTTGIENMAISWVI